MNSNVRELYEISQKPKRLIIGLMSGTSLDGLDIALCEFSGNRNTFNTRLQVKVLNFETVPYTQATKDKIRSTFCKEQVNLQDLCLLNPWIANLHAELVLAVLQKWQVRPEDVDLIASHGQTIYHAPKSLHNIPLMPNSTLQIGDGDHISVKTGIITLCDFRQKNIAAGGEGAPLALYGDFLLFSKPGENRIMLNIGGIANFTFLPEDGDFRKIFCTDTGPGNTLIDAHIQKYYSDLAYGYDKDGEIARSGKINTILLEQLKAHKFFKEEESLSIPKPKTTGQELFNIEFVENAQEISYTVDIPKSDLVATLTQFSAETISGAILNVVSKFSGNHLNSDSSVKIFASGGGKHNKVLMEHLKSLLPLPNFEFKEFDDLAGFSHDAKEAVLFATLANETICEELHQKVKISEYPLVSMGKICFPN